MEPGGGDGVGEERDSKTTSHSSLATSSGSGSNAGDLATDFQRLAVGQSGSRDAGASPSQASSGHSSRLISPAPSNGSSIRSPIVGIHSRSLVKKLQENGSVCSVHPPGSVQSSSRQSTPTSVSPRKGGLKKRTKTPSGGSTSSGDSSGSPPPGATPRHRGNLDSAKGGRGSVHFAESEQQTPSPSTKMAGYYHGNSYGASRGRRYGGNKSTPQQGSREGFDTYMSLEQVQRGLKKGELIEGVLRINPKKCEDAYISAPGGATDILICGRRDQNRALEGDRVVVELKPKYEWKVNHERALDYIRIMPEEDFRKLYVGVHLEPNVAEMVHNARHGNMMHMKLFSADDDDAALGGMIGGSFADPEAIFAINREPAAPPPPPPAVAAAGAVGGPPRVRVRDFRDTERDVDSDSSYDIVIEADVDSEEEGKKEQPEDRESPEHPPGSVPVPPDELLGDVMFDADSDYAESDGEGVALQYTEDKDFFDNLRASREPPPSTVVIESIEQSVNIGDNGGNESCVIEEVKETLVIETENERVEVCSEVRVTEGSERASVCDESKDTGKVEEGQEGSDGKNSDWEDIDDDDDDDVVVPSSRPDETGHPSDGKKRKNRRKEKKKNAYGIQQQEQGQQVVSVESVQRSFAGVGPTPRLSEPPQQQGFQQGYQRHSYPTRHEPEPTVFNYPQAREDGNKKDDKRKSWKNSDFKQFDFNCGLTAERLAEFAQRGNKGCDALVQRTGRVVYIMEEHAQRSAVGYLRPPPTFYHERQSPTEVKRVHTHVFFHPRDMRFPRLRIPVNTIPPELLLGSNREYLKNTMFMASIYKWTVPGMALGKYVGPLGTGEEIGAETQGILHRHNIDMEEICDSVLDSLPPAVYQMPEDPEAPREATLTFPVGEFRTRKDFTGLCICTVDPETARDLDDAVSLRVLEDGAYEVGVHIADVSYYVQEGTMLDAVAQQRATTVYLVHCVVPMLPRLLCEHLCSLNPGEPKLAFSVIWKMDKDARVLDHWVGRSIIESKCKLSYGHAQTMIDAEDPDSLDPKDFPKIHGSEYTLNDISRMIRTLDELARKRRSGRFSDKGGSLSLDVPKICFRLNESSLPEAYDVQQRGESNKMIEEFMLLANMSVAVTIFHGGPMALLRRHPEPNPFMLDQLVMKMQAMGVAIDGTSSASLNSSLNALKDTDPAAYAVVTLLLAKPMQLAKYFIADENTSPEECHHFALHVEHYTHFTSPIRRYPDILVHRMLAAVLGEGPELQVDKKRLDQIADHCNNKKDSAKKCSEESAELFFYIYLRENGPIIADAIVTCINDRSVDVMLHDLGRTGRVYLDRIGMKTCSYGRQSGKATIDLTWDRADGQPCCIQQRLEIFTPVRVEVQQGPQCPKFLTVLVPPEGAIKSKEKRSKSMQNEGSFTVDKPNLELLDFGEEAEQLRHH